MRPDPRARFDATPLARATPALATLARATPALAALALAAVAAGALFLTGRAAAQEVSGTVVDRAHERPVSGARVVLLDSDLVPVDSTGTDDAGRFGVAAPDTGRYLLVIRPPAHFSYTEPVRVDPGGTELGRVRVPLLSAAAARTMGEAIARERSFQLPLDELCPEPLRPWEAGILVGVTRERSTLRPIPGVLVTVEPLPGDSAASPAPEPRADAAERPPPPAPRSAPRSRLSTDSGAFWFCNVPAGRVRVVARAGGLPPDTSTATVRAGTISWSDALIRRPR